MKILILAATVSLLMTTTLTAIAQDQNFVEHNSKNFLNKLAEGGGKPLEKLAVKEARDALVNVQKRADLPNAEVSHKTISQDGQSVSLTIVRPKGTAKKTSPVFMFFHGGGWVLGDFQTHERFVRDLVIGTGAVAVFVNYSPSPEAHYPVTINQAYAATKWVAQYGKEINVDGSRLAVAGNSVGGNMAAVVSLMAKEKGSPVIKLQVLFWPVTDATFENTSYNQFAEEYFLTKNMMKWFWDNYTTDLKQRKEIYASPLNATIEQLIGLPPALIQIAENDVLRDEGDSYAHHLDAAGAPVTSTRYNGMIHDFGLLNVLSQVTATRSALQHFNRHQKS